MGVVAWTWLLVALTFAVSMAVAVWARARSTIAYYVAEKQVSPLVNGLATAADWMSAATFVSMAGLVAVRGRDGGAYLMGWTGGYVLLAVLLAPHLRRWGKYTVPQFVGERYDSRAARLVALLCALVVSLTYLAAQVRGVAVVLARFAEVPVATGVLVAMAVVFVYAATGGMKSLTYTQVAQYAVLIVAYLVPAALVSRRLTGQLVPQLGLGGALTPEGAALLGGAPGATLLATLDGIVRDLGFPPYTSGARPRADVLLTTATLMLGTAGLPHILVRFFTVPKVRDARASAGWALLAISVLYTAAPAVAAFSRAGVTRALHRSAAVERPEWFRAWERAGLARFEDRDGDGRMTISADPARNEVTIDPDVLVLATPEVFGLAPWVVALLAAGALAAAASTAAGLVLVVSALVSHDLLKGILLPRLSERAELGAARVATGVAVLVTGLMALRPPASVAQVVAVAFGFAAASFFPVLVLGVFWRRATKEGAIAGMLVGLGVTAAYTSFFLLLRPELNRPDGWLLGVSPEGIGALGALAGALVMVAVSLRSPPPSDRALALVDRLRGPEDARHPLAPGARR